MTAADLPPERHVRWERTFRLVPSRYPPVDLFERVADPADWEVLAAIESLTNDRLRDEVGDISLVPPDERVAGPGASPIMAAFTHVGFPSRFTDGSYGVYYASQRFEGALREVAYHQERFLRRTKEPRLRLELRTYVGALDARLRDVRGGWPAVHHPDDYAAGQALGRALRGAGAGGVVYDSVRAPGTANLAAFRPRVLAAKSRPGSRPRPHVVQGAHVFLGWDGHRIDRYLVVGDTVGQEVAWRPLPPVAS